MKYTIKNFIKDFPDEKMIEEKCMQEFRYYCGKERAELFDAGKLFAQWAISHIESQANEGFEDQFKQGRNKNGDTPSQVEIWQAAVISTAAKYEEKLRGKDAEIERTREACIKSCVCDRLQSENEQLKAAVKELSSDLSFLRYSSHAHALYWYEQKYKRKRDDIKSVRSVGDFGYIMCEVYFTKDDYDFISEECEAGMILDWAKMKGIKNKGE